MERLVFVLWMGVILFLPSLFAAEESKKPAAAGNLQKIYSVEEIVVRTLESHPEQVQIEAKGSTRSGGWTNVQLRRTDRAGKNGTIELEFVATPPEGIATQAITPVKATLTIPKPTGYKGVRVVAETNEKTAK